MWYIPCTVECSTSVIMIPDYLSRHMDFILCPKSHMSQVICPKFMIRYLCYLCTLDLVGSGGHVVERRTVNRGDGGSIPPAAVSKLSQFRSHHICLSFGGDTKSWWSLLSGVYARGSKISHTWGKYVPCSGLTNSY